MEIALAILLWSLFGLAILIGLALDIVGLFGNWVILLAVVAAWAVSGLEYFSLTGIVIMLILATVGEVLEFAVAGYGARKFGGSPGSMWAALAGCIVGGIVGAPLFPILGTVIGACAGAFVAAAAYDYIEYERKVYDAAWIGIGAAIGKIGGMFAKLFCGLFMLLVAALTF